MKLKNPLLVVKDLEKSKAFYREVLGLRVTVDFGANVTLTGGLCLQTLETWKDFIQVDETEIAFGGKDAEVYFEEDDFDGFLKTLESVPGVDYVHQAVEHSWGQRVVRLYDPDRHIIEIGENMKSVCKRFVDGGMTVEETAARMDIPVKNVQALLR